MFYLEDLAYEVKMPKVIKARNIVAAGIFAFGLMQTVLIFTGKSSQKNIIQNNQITISDYQQKCSLIDDDTEKFRNKNNMQFYNSWEQGNAVAELQTQYGGFNSNATIKNVTEQAKKTASELDSYIKDPIARTPWYANMYQDYFWVYLNRQTSLVENIPSIWVCRSYKNNIILGVAIAEYDALGEVFEDFKFFYTAKGHALLEEDAKIINDTVISSADYINYYKNINKIVEDMADTENNEIFDDEKVDDDSVDDQNTDDDINKNNEDADNNLNDDEMDNKLQNEVSVEEN